MDKGWAQSDSTLGFGEFPNLLSPTHLPSKSTNAMSGRYFQSTWKDSINICDIRSYLEEHVTSQTKKVTYSCHWQTPENGIQMMRIGPFVPEFDSGTITFPGKLFIYRGNMAMDWIMSSP
jgi:hypothetical protein